MATELDLDDVAAQSPKALLELARLRVQLEHALSHNAAEVEDAARYRFAHTLEGQVVVMETLKSKGAEALDQALDDAMAEDADDGDDEPECERCGGDGRDPWNDYLLPCPACQGEQRP